MSKQEEESCPSPSDDKKRTISIREKLRKIAMYPWKVLRGVWNYIHEMFRNEKSAFWTMVFTAFLTIFTYFLYQVADRTDRTMRATQRAFINFDGVSLGMKIINPVTKKISSVQLYARWENSGTTPIKKGRIYSNYQWRSDRLPENFDFPDLQGEGPQPFIAGPKANVSTTPIAVPIEVLEDVRQGKRHLYLWGWVTYSDIFEDTPRHVSEFCTEISDILLLNSPDITDPNTQINAGNSNCPQHNCLDEDCRDYKTKTSAQ